MGWLFGIVVFLTVIFFLVRSPEFRNTALGIVVLAALWLGYTYFTDQDRERREASVIPPAEIELANLTLANQYASTWRVTGLITNHSRYNLRSVSFKVTVQNCADRSESGVTADCHVVGDTSVSYFTNVPSGQQRAIDEYVYLQDLPPLTNWSWFYSDVRPTADLSR